MSAKYNFGYYMSGTIFSKNYFCNSYNVCIPRSHNIPRSHVFKYNGYSKLRPEDEDAT